MEFSIRHFISGRIRLHLPSLCRKKAVAEGALVWLQAQHGVKSARLNYTCASLVIEYDVKFEAMLRAMLGRLSVMSIDDLQKLVVPVGQAPAKASTPLAMQSGKAALDLAQYTARPPDAVFVAGFQRQSVRPRCQYAADAVERLSDRVAGMARLAA